MLMQDTMFQQQVNPAKLLVQQEPTKPQLGKHRVLTQMQDISF
jgi:hypothetical protein